jgi:hypothetical protein
VDHAVDVAFETDEQAELGLVLDFAFDFGAGRMAMRECFPRILERLLEAVGSTSRTTTLTSWLVDRILPGCTFFLVQDISEMWIRPSMPGSSSTNAP